MSTASPIPLASGGLAVRLFFVMSSGYLMSYGLRAINATIAPELVQDLGLSNTELGSLTSAYFLAFAVMQLPVGIWLDRFGPRRVDAVLMAVAASGCIVFATAHGFAQLWLGRALLGVGFAAGLMACFAMFRLWFPPHQQTRLAAWTMTVGTCGVLTATLPVRALLSITDWRGVFLVCAAILFGLSALMWFALPRAREPHGERSQSLLALLRGYGEILRNGFFWRMALLGGLVQGGFIAIQTLWLGPWFIRVLGMTPQASASWLFAFNVALLLGFVAVGVLAPRVGPKEATTVRVAGIAALLCTGLTGLAAAWPVAAGVWAWLALAVCNTVFVPIHSRVGMSFPGHLAGRALTAYNLVIFVSAFAVQSILGVVVDWLLAGGWTETDAFRAGLAALVATQLVAWLAFVRWPALCRVSGLAKRPASGG